MKCAFAWSDLLAATAGIGILEALLARVARLDGFLFTMNHRRDMITSGQAIKPCYNPKPVGNARRWVWMPVCSLEKSRLHTD